MMPQNRLKKYHSVLCMRLGINAEMSIQGSVKPDGANLLEDAWDRECILLGHWRFKCSSFGVNWFWCMVENQQTNRQKTNKQTYCKNIAEAARV